MPEKIEESVTKKVAALLNQIGPLDRNGHVFPEGKARIIEMINKDHDLEFDEEEISPAGLQALFEILPDCQISHLALPGKEIGTEGLQAICQFLENPSCQLTYLCLSSNRIEDEDILEPDLVEEPSLVGALKTNKSLRSLDLSYNPITSQGVNDLIGALADCRITSFELRTDVYGNQKIIKEESAKVLADILENSSEFLKFDFEGCVMSDGGVQILSGALRANKNIISGDFANEQLNQIVRKNSDLAKATLSQLKQACSKPELVLSSQLLSELLPRIEVVKYLLNEDGREEVFKKVQDFCLSQYENFFDNALNKDQYQKTKNLLSRILSEQKKYSSEFSNDQKGKLIFSPNLLRFVIALQETKEINFLVKRFNEGKSPKIKLDWDKIPVDVLKNAVEKFVNQDHANQATNSDDSRNTKRARIEEEPSTKQNFSTKQGRIDFLIKNGIENHKDYDRLRTILEPNPNQNPNPNPNTHSKSSSQIGAGVTSQKI